MRRIGCAVVLWMLAVVMACGPKEPAAREQKPLAPSPWNMVLATTPAKPRMDQPTTFLVKLTDKQDKPLEGAQLQGSLVMPLMDMGKNEFTFADKGQGQYQGTGKFTMAGPWELIITAKQGQVTGQQKFDLRVAE